MELLSEESIQTLRAALGELQQVVASLDDAQMPVVSNCTPWTVRQLASHALNNQLFWAGLVTGNAEVSIEDVMAGTSVEGDLREFADDVTDRCVGMWRTDGVLTEMHGTPAGDLPGAVVIMFATIDAFAHAWDLASSVGRSYAFAGDMVPSVASIIGSTAEGARALGLIKPPTTPPADATESERLMALIGRSVPRS